MSSSSTNSWFTFRFVLILFNTLSAKLAALFILSICKASSLSKCKVSLFNVIITCSLSHMACSKLTILDSNCSNSVVFESSSIFNCSNFCLAASKVEHKVCFFILSFSVTFDIIMFS
eukprot:NODE_319_length_11107_cov_0.311228.p5 type:complete len:117 gc:universal NODE_319_length_11107_cov_0.311228:6649-6999(+)